MPENKHDNANYIFHFFRNRGWTAQSICGMLGNMEVESGIIADIDEFGGGGGYGLVQWTPKSKLVNWANNMGLNYRTVDTQCRRIEWELLNGGQYYSTPQYPLSFSAYTQSTSSPTYLANAFLYNYERPANKDQPQRGVWAESWYATLAGSSTTDSNGCPYGTSTATVQNGSVGIHVSRCQWYLLEYNISVGSAGIDGICGPATVAGIKTFQQKYGLTDDGICGLITWAALENNFENREDEITMSQYSELLSRIQTLDSLVAALREHTSSQYSESSSRIQTLDSLVTALRERTSPIYNYASQVPDWAQPVVQDAINRGIITGEAVDELALSYSDLRALTWDYRRENN